MCLIFLIEIVKIIDKIQYKKYNKYEKYELLEGKMNSMKGKHIFGTVKVGEKGQIVIPKKAREIFDIKPGDNLLMLGDEEQGIAIIKSDQFLGFAQAVMNAHKGEEK